MIETYFFPIAEGNLGDLIYLSLEAATLEKLYYCHHETGPDQASVLLADSLSYFILTLFVVQEETPEILSDDELERVNTNCRKTGLPPVNNTEMFDLPTKRHKAWAPGMVQGALLFFYWSSIPFMG